MADDNYYNQLSESESKDQSEGNEDAPKSDYYQYQNFYGGYYTNYTTNDCDNKLGQYYQTSGAYYAPQYEYIEENNDSNAQMGGK